MFKGELHYKLYFGPKCLVTLRNVFYPKDFHQAGIQSFPCVMAACTIFDEDEVCIPASAGGFKYGLVVESSEYISSDEEDDEYENKVQKGTVKVAWHPSGDETVVVENTVKTS